MRIQASVLVILVSFIPAARGEFFLRESIPDLFDLGAWRALFWSTSYAAIGSSGFVGAGSPSVGFNYQSADSGGTGHVARARAEYSASIKGAQGALEKLSLDLGWIYQRRIGGKGSLGAG